MAIYRALEQASFDATATRCLAQAYEGALARLGLVDRTDPITELIAAKIIQVYRSGEHDPARLSERAITELGVPKRGIQ